MKNHQSFSPGLLYTVAPENFSTLHLRDKDEMSKFGWKAYVSQLEEDSFLKVVLDSLKIGVAKQ